MWPIIGIVIGLFAAIALLLACKGASLGDEMEEAPKQKERAAAK
jgi:hypothetical protein